MTIATVTGDQGDDRLVLAVRGEIDLSNAADVQNEIIDLTGDDLESVLLDLSDVHYMDSAGLRMLFMLATRLDGSQIGLELLVPDDSPVRGIIELVGLDSVTTVRATPDADEERARTGS